MRGEGKNGKRRNVVSLGGQDDQRRGKRRKRKGRGEIEGRKTKREVWGENRRERERGRGETPQERNEHKRRPRGGGGKPCRIITSSEGTRGSGARPSPGRWHGRPGGRVADNGTTNCVSSPVAFTGSSELTEDLEGNSSVRLTTVDSVERPTYTLSTLKIGREVCKSPRRDTETREGVTLPGHLGGLRLVLRDPSSLLTSLIRGTCKVVTRGDTAFTDHTVDAVQDKGRYSTTQRVWRTIT